MGDLLQQGGAVLLEAFGIIMMALVAWAISALRRRFNIESNEALERELMRSVRSAVLYAEEWAAHKLKLDYDKEEVSGEQKLALALSLLQQLYPKAYEHELVAKIHEVLAETEGLGATGRAVGSPRGIVMLDPYGDEEQGQ